MGEGSARRADDNRAALIAALIAALGSKLSGANDNLLARLEPRHPLLTHRFDHEGGARVCRRMEGGAHRRAPARCQLNAL